MLKKVIMITLLCFITLWTTSVKAAECSNDEIARLKKDAAKVKMVYEEATKPMDPDEYGLIEDMQPGDTLSTSYFKIIISNISDSFNLEISNDFDDTVNQIWHNEMINGTYSFDWERLGQVTKFKLKIISNDNSACPGENLATLYLTTPKYNIWSDTMYCYDITDLEACKKYLNVDLSREQLMEEIEKYHEKENENKKENNSLKNNIIKIIKKHKVLFILGFLSIIGLGATIVIRKRKRVY